MKIGDRNGAAGIVVSLDPVAATALCVTRKDFGLATIDVALTGLHKGGPFEGHWVLPTIEQLVMIYTNKRFVASISNGFFWSATQAGDGYQCLNMQTGAINTQGAFTINNGGQVPTNNYMIFVENVPYTPPPPIATVGQMVKGDIVVYVAPGGQTALIADQVLPPGAYLMDELVAACAQKGPGWRLPTIDELNILASQTLKDIVPMEDHWSISVPAHAPDQFWVRNMCPRGGFIHSISKGARLHAQIVFPLGYN